MLILSQLYKRLVTQFSEGPKNYGSAKNHNPAVPGSVHLPHLPSHDEGHRQILNVLHMDTEFLFKHKKLRHK